MSNSPSEDTPEVTLKLPQRDPIDKELIKSPNESIDMFNIRSIYSKLALRVFKNQINIATAILIGRIAANNVLYGTKYSDEVNDIVNYINDSIKQSPTN